MKVIDILIIGFMLLPMGLAIGTLKDQEQKHYDALAEAFVRGCEPEQDQIRQTIEDFCTKPLTKGKTNVSH